MLHIISPPLHPVSSHTPPEHGDGSPNSPEIKLQLDLHPPQFLVSVCKLAQSFLVGLISSQNVSPAAQSSCDVGYVSSVGEAGVEVLVKKIKARTTAAIKTIETIIIFLMKNKKATGVNRNSKPL
jgi:hypothetical protein